MKDHGIGHKFSDVFSNIFAYVMILPLTAAPMLLLYRAVKYVKQIKKREQQKLETTKIK